MCRHLATTEEGWTATKPVRADLGSLGLEMRMASFAWMPSGRKCREAGADFNGEGAGVEGRQREVDLR